VKAILTRKGAKRLGLRGRAGTIVDVWDVRTMPWGVRMGATVYAMATQIYTPGHGKDCALIPIGSDV
jgi:hypothetical protein